MAADDEEAGWVGEDLAAAAADGFAGRRMFGRRVQVVTVSKRSCRLKQSLVISRMLWLTS